MIFSKIVLTHNEKKSSSDRENLKNSRLKAQNLQKKLRLLEKDSMYSFPR